MNCLEIYTPKQIVGRRGRSENASIPRKRAREKVGYGDRGAVIKRDGDRMVGARARRSVWPQSTSACLSKWPPSLYQQTENIRWLRHSADIIGVSLNFIMCTQVNAFGCFTQSNFFLSSWPDNVHFFLYFKEIIISCIRRASIRLKATA